jgi:hypothetical protein
MKPAIFINRRLKGPVDRAATERLANRKLMSDLLENDLLFRWLQGCGKTKHKSPMWVIIVLDNNAIATEKQYNYLKEEDYRNDLIILSQLISPSREILLTNAPTTGLKKKWDPKFGANVAAVLHRNGAIACLMETDQKEMHKNLLKAVSKHFGMDDLSCVIKEFDWLGYNRDGFTSVSVEFAPPPDKDERNLEIIKVKLVSIPLY